MPKPTSKNELLAIGEQNFTKLNELIDTYSREELEKDFSPGTLNRNVRDVLTHLHHWHLMMMDWYKVGMQGIKPDMPAKGYTWKTMPALNKKIWEDYQDIKLDQARNLLNNSYQEVRTIILQHSNQELFEKKRYKWTGSTSLGVYFISNTSSHYAWAIKLIKKAKK